MTKHSILTLTIAALMPLLSFANDTLHIADSMRHVPAVVKEHKQRSFPLTVPPGNYSGITYLGNQQYAVVSDKSDTGGFFIFTIDIDTVSGKIISVRNEGFFSDGLPNRDQEGIAYMPFTNTLYISGEGDNSIREYTRDGKQTGRCMQVPDIFSESTPNYGLESLTYNAATHRFWTVSESTLQSDGGQATPLYPVRNRLRLQNFDDNLQPIQQYYYEMDEPIARSAAATYAMGVSELCAMDDGGVLVLEREFYVSPGKLGSFVNCKLYITYPDSLQEGHLLDKTLLTEFCTRLSLFSRAIANYEGMCLGPKLAGGRQVLVLISDSQNQYKGVLKDWFKTLVLE